MKISFSDFTNYNIWPARYTPPDSLIQEHKLVLIQHTNLMIEVEFLKQKSYRHLENDKAVSIMGLSRNLPQLKNISDYFKIIPVKMLFSLIATVLHDYLSNYGR